MMGGESCESKRAGADEMKYWSVMIMTFNNVFIYFKALERKI